MPEINDLHLHHQTSDDVGYVRSDVLDDSLLGPERSKWIVLILLFVISAAVVGYVVLRRQRAPQQTAVAPVSTPAPAPAPAAKGGPLVQAENIPLPPLPQMDALMRQLVVKLSSHPKVLAWLATNGL